MVSAAPPHRSRGIKALGTDDGGHVSEFGDPRADQGDLNPQAIKHVREIHRHTKMIHAVLEAIQLRAKISQATKFPDPGAALLGLP